MTAAAGLFLLPLLLWLPSFILRERSEPVLRVTFLDVGQGDSTVIEGPTGRVVVIDGGGVPGTDEREGSSDPGARVVVPYLRHRGINRVDLLVATHPDDDHAQGLIAVTNRLRVDAALDSGFPGDSAPAARLRARLRQRRIPVYRARRGQVIDLGGGAQLEVLHPGARPTEAGRSASNNQSVVLRAVYGRARLLLTGDAEAEAEADLMMSTSSSRLSADLLKVGHHGSRWSTGEAFLAAVSPGVAVISCGRNNRYNHPHREVLERLARRGVRIFRTDRDGAVTLETDGKRLSIKSSMLTGR